MVTPKFIVFLLSAGILIHYATSAKQPVASQKSKLCSNVACEEVLFKSRVKRVMGINNDPSFLNLAENSIISVVAVKFSDRPDIMEGKLSDDGPIGFFYAGAIDLLPFAEFLRTAIDEKKEMLLISQNPADTGDKRIVGYVHSETDLVRDYNAKNAQAAAEHGLPAPTPLPIPEPAGGHGHSHGGHGHSHGGHGHSHGGHGHSHGHPAPTPTPAAAPVQQEPVTTPAPKQEPPKIEETPKEELKEEVKQELNLNSVLGAPPTVPPTETIGINDMDAEIDRMIREEEERLLAAKTAQQPETVVNEVKTETPEEVTQPPLVLTSLPAEPVTPPPVEAVPEAVPVVPVVPVTEAPITTTPPPPPQNVPEPIEVVTPAPEPVPVELPPLPQEPVVTTTPPAPVSQEPIAQPQEVVTPPPATFEEPITTTTPPPPPPVQDESVGVCYKDECDGLQTPPPSPIVENKSQEDEDFLKWEEERNKREAKPYEDAYGHQFKDLPPVPPQASAGIIEFIRSTFGLGNVTDGSVILYLNFTFVAASLVLYIIVRAVSSGSEPDVLDRQAYFNLVTKHRELQLQLQQKTSELQNLHATGLQQQQQQQAQPVTNHEPELLALRQQIEALERELQGFQTRCHDSEVQYSQLNEVAQHKDSQIIELTARLNEYAERFNDSQELSRQFDSTRAELDANRVELDTVRAQFYEAQNTAAGLQQQLDQQLQEYESSRQAIQDKTSEAHGLLSRISQLEQTKDALEIELGDLRNENAGLLVTIQQLELDKSQNEGGSAAESGGSGWSDFGGDDVEDLKEVKEVKDEKTPDASNAELADMRARYKQHGETIEELNTLKAKLEVVEKELSHYKKLHENQGKGKSENDLRLQSAVADVAAAKKQADETALKKTELEDQLKETLKMLSNSMNRGSECDKIIDTLKEKIETLKEEKSSNEKKLLEVDVVLQKKQLELDSLLQKKQLELDTVIQEKDEKIRKLEADCKRYQLQYSKLETKSFHDVMKYKKQLDDYETSKMLSGQGMSLASRDVFNAPDLRPGSDRQLGSPLDAPIWDEPEYVAPSHQVPPLQQDDYFSSGSMTMPSKRRSSRRSDHRLLAGIGGEQSPSDREEKGKSKKEGVHRRRSRSHGRPLPVFNADPYALGSYLPGSSDSSFMSQQAPGFHPLSGRHSKSGHLHYSSGGSNGARSPPPEMPLLSAIPPPGARKPTSKRLGPGYLGK